MEQQSRSKQCPMNRLVFQIDLAANDEAKRGKKRKKNKNNKTHIFISYFEEKNIL